MVPVSIEEQIICHADKFYSKIGSSALAPKPVSEILKGLMPFGLSKVEPFKNWLHLFNGKTSHADGIG